MTSSHLILAGACLFGVSGFPGLLAPKTARWGERFAVAATTLAAVVGLLGAFLPGPAPELTLPGSASPPMRSAGSSRCPSC